MGFSPSSLRRGTRVAIACASILAPAVATNGAAPKNVIIMIADGAGYNHFAASSYFSHGRLGGQPYDAFPVRIGMSTLPEGGAYDPSHAWAWFEYVRRGHTDSAAAATAMSTGVKTENGMIGVTPSGAPVKHLIERAEELGKATGVVTTVPISHATPAGFVAHETNRGRYMAIASDMLLDSRADVVMGAGHPAYAADGRYRTSHSYTWVGGKGVWDAIVAGQTSYDGNAFEDADGDSVADPWTLVETKAAFEALAEGATPKRVLGIAQVAETLQFERPDSSAVPFGTPLIATVPDLATMSRGALNVLDDDPDGLFLMVEGGAPDKASHANDAARMLEEMIDFNRAVAAVVAWVDAKSSWSETLVIVTADHETAYLWGPGSGPATGDVEGDTTWAAYRPIVNRGRGVMPDMVWYNETSHTNSLVPFHAKGAGSDAFVTYADEVDPVRGAYIDNTEIATAVFRLWSDDILTPLPRSWTLTVSTAGSGSVKRYPDAGSYDAGTSVRLTATPASGWTFSGWSGGATGTANPITVPMDDNTTVTAIFAQSGDGLAAQINPNPFNPATEVRFRTPKAARVEVAVYDAAGRRVRTLLDESLAEGEHHTTFDARGLGSGVYVIVVSAGGERVAERAVHVH